MPNFTVPLGVFDPTFRDRVRDANPLEQVINDTLLAAGHPPLAGTGEEIAGWHPAHGSASGLSLKVNTAKQVYNCFNCGEAGDVFTWVMHARGCMFIEALRYLADRANLPWPSFDPAQQQQWQQLQQERHDLEELFRAAVEFFHQQLTQEHIDFCKEQWGLTLETVQQYKLGFSPTVPDALQQYLRRKRFAEDAIQKSGLVVQVGNRWHDFFQGRIMFPYWRDLPYALSSLPGTPLYFIGRRLDGATPDVPWEQAKYRKQLVHGAKHPYVSPTITNTYFYGEHAVRGLQAHPLLVTEGVADCLGALQADIPTISPVTVRFSKACHPRLLQLARHAQRILICNDNEDNQAGTKGALATAAFLDAAGIDVRLVTLPRPDGVSKVDLADFLKHHSAKDLQSLCAQAVTYLDARLATYTASADGFANCQTAQQFVTDVLCQCPDKARALAFLRYRVKEYFGLHKPDIDGLVREYQSQQRQNGHRRTAPGRRLVEATEDTGDRDGLLANIGDAEDMDALAQGARQDDDERPPEVRYRATRHGLVWEKPTQDGPPTDVLLTNFTATIATEIIEDDGAELQLRFALTAQLNGKMHCFEIPAAQFVGMSWVTAHLGAMAIVMPGMTLKDHARAAIQLLSPQVDHRRVYTHLGWRHIGEDWRYLHAGGAIGMHGAVEDITVAPGQALAAYHLAAPPDDAAARAAILASLRLLDVAPDAVTIPVYAALWRAVLGNVDCSVHLVGPTGQGKSEIAALIQQHWGAAMDARHLPASWLSTGNALEGIAFQAKDAVLVVDDFCPAGVKTDIARQHKEADRLVRAQGNRSGRQRMRADSTLRPSKPPRGLILSTGEDTPRGQSLRARMLILDVAPGMLKWDTLTSCQDEAAAGVYTQALAGFVRWLAPRYGEVAQGLPTELGALRQQARQGGHRRTPDIVAHLAVGMRYLLVYAHACGGLTQEECQTYWERTWQALGEAAQAQHEHQASEDPVERFRALLSAALTAGLAHVAAASTRTAPPSIPECWGWRGHERETGEATERVWQPLGACIGWLHGDRLYLDPEAAFSVVQRLADSQQAPLPVTQQTLWKRLHEQGLLRRETGQQKNQVRRTIGGKREYVVDISASYVPETGPSGPSGPHAPQAQQNQCVPVDLFPAWYQQQPVHSATTKPVHTTQPQSPPAWTDSESRTGPVSQTKSALQPHLAENSL
jgi:DNA primase catalytic core